MTVYVLDCDYYFLKNLEALFLKTNMNVKASYFTNAIALGEAFEREKPDVLFIEREAYGALSLMAKIKTVRPEQKIVIVTSQGRFTPDLLNSQPYGVLQKPFNELPIKKLLYPIAHPILARLQRKK